MCTFKPREARILLSEEETRRGWEEIGAPGEGEGRGGGGRGRGQGRGWGDLERAIEAVLKEPKRKTLDEDGGERLEVF